MGNNLTIDPDTNLPALPEGHFWRVKQDEYGYLDVQIRRKRKRLWSALVETGAVLHREGFNVKLTSLHVNVPKAIAKAAERVYVKWMERTEGYRLYEERVALLGDYPPKKLDTELKGL